MNELNCEIIEDLGTIRTMNNGIALKLCLVSWNGRTPRYELRKWGTRPDGSPIAYQGFTFTNEEVEQLKTMLEGVGLNPGSLDVS